MSSRAGRTRCARSSSSLALAPAMSASVAAGARLVCLATSSREAATCRCQCAFEVGGSVEAEPHGERREFVRRQRRAHRLAVPDVELALVAFGVGVEARVVAALRRLHLVHHPCRGLGRHARIGRVAAGERGVGVHREQRAVVVQHLFEVRDHPLRIDRVAAEAAAQLIVDAALGHAPQAEGGHVQRLQVGLGRVHRGAPVAQQAFETLRMRELRRAAEAAEVRVEGARVLRPAGLERLVGQLGVVRGRRRLELRERRHQRLVLLAQVVAVVAVVFGDAQQDVLERRQPEARLLREVGAAEEGPLIVVGQEHGERPAAAALRQHLLCDLVDLVDVGPLLAVDLDVDECSLRMRGGGLVFEALMGRYVAPVTGVISHAQVNGFSVRSRLLECLRSPRDTNPPDCGRADAGTDLSRRRDGWCTPACRRR